jgi:hypothetical protein
VTDLLRDPHSQGATICTVTHGPRYARHADRTVHLFDGRIEEERTRRDRGRTIEGGVPCGAPRSTQKLNLATQMSLSYCDTVR